MSTPPTTSATPAEAWNEQSPPGTPVLYCEHSGAALILTVTRSRAWYLSSEQPVVLIEKYGSVSSVSIDTLIARPSAAERAKARIAQVRSRARSQAAESRPLGIGIGLAPLYRYWMPDTRIDGVDHLAGGAALMLAAAALTKCPPSSRRVFHLAYRHKKMRIRKKNLRRLRKLWPQHFVLESIALAGSSMLSADMAMRASTLVDSW